MNLALIVLLLITLSSTLSACSADAESQRLKGQCRRDLIYVPGSNDPFQSLDLYIPENPKSAALPVIVWIHGGAWMSGDKNHPPANMVLERGYALASLNYRLSNRHSHPAQIHDCKAAIRFLRSRAREFGIDPERIGVWGHSAGGHLAALLGTSADVQDLEGELGNQNFSSRVQAVVEWSGPSDFLTIAAQAPADCKIDFKSKTNPVAVLMGENQSPTAYLAASPINYVSADDPPFMILHAEDDDVVPVGQAKELCELLKKSSVKHDCHIPRYGGHGLGRKEFFDLSLDFFDKHL